MKRPNRKFKDAIYEQFSRIGNAVSSPKRLERLDLLCQGEKTVETLSQETGLTVANTSQHLQTLRAARLVEAEKEGLSVPLGQLKELLAKLPRDQEIVAYCRGPYFAVEAVEMLRKKGVKAIRLEEGIQDWQSMGLTLDVGD